MAAEINGYAPGTLTYIYLTSDGGADLDALYDLVPYLDEHVKVVSHEVLINMALEHARQQESTITSAQSILYRGGTEQIFVKVCPKVWKWHPLPRQKSVRGTLFFCSEVQIWKICAFGQMQAQICWYTILHRFVRGPAYFQQQRIIKNHVFANVLFYSNVAKRIIITTLSKRIAYYNGFFFF